MNHKRRLPSGRVRENFPPHDVCGPPPRGILRTDGAYRFFQVLSSKYQVSPTLGPVIASQALGFPTERRT